MSIEELRNLLAAATLGPWRNCGHDRGGCLCGQVWSIPNDALLVEGCMSDDVPRATSEQLRANAALIAVLRNNAAALLDRLEAAERVIELAKRGFVEEEFDAAAQLVWEAKVKAALATYDALENIK